MVGDKEHDVLGAQKAGIPCVAVTYGYGSEKELGQVSPWRLVSSVAELGEYLLSLN
jgi:phosphoglycolate phosphatase